MLPRPHVYAFNFGVFRIATVLDAVDVRAGLGASFAIGQKEADIRALAAANFIDPDRFEHPFIPTLVDTGSAKILFDTGLGEPESALIANLSTLGLGVADIDVVVLTHGHPDHIGGLLRDEAIAFPRARYIFGRTEYDFWMRGENVMEARRNNRELFVRTCSKLADRITLIDPGQEIAPGIVALDAAGHSPGLLAYSVDSAGKRLLIWSDTCLHYVLSLASPDGQAAVDDDKVKAVATRQRLLAMAADERLLVAGFHMPFPGLGHVERAGDAYRWVPVSYQLNL